MRRCVNGWRAGAALVLVAAFAGAATNAPARKPIPLAGKVDGAIEAAAALAPVRRIEAEAGDVAVKTLGGAVGLKGVEVVAGLSGLAPAAGVEVVAGLASAAAASNRVVVTALPMATGVMVEAVRQIHAQQGMVDDAAFLGDGDVWRQGPLGEIITQALRARSAGDRERYEALVARYWKEYRSAQARRQALGGRR